MVIFQHKNVAQGYFKINNCSKQEQAFLAWSKSFWNTVLWNEVALHATLFTYEQKWHLDLPAKIIASVGESTSLNTRPRATLCHFSFFFQCVFKYFLQGVVNYWSIFRIKINLSESFNGLGENCFFQICRNRPQAHDAMQYTEYSLVLALFLQKSKSDEVFEKCLKK